MNSITEMLKEAVNNHGSLFGILLASFLILIAVGPYTNWDAQTEYQAAIGVIKWGYPYLTFGTLVNQPPLGFYIEALFLKVVGESYPNGIGLITFFGVGSILLLYEIGRVLYNKRTGLFAAALFSLSPWQAAMSRIFLIDTQCLFFSLLYLLFGIWAIRRGSQKLLFISGTLFALALLTKGFAVFMLVPLLLFSVFRRKKDVVAWKDTVVFILPALVLSLLWYQVITRIGVLNLFLHSDFYLPISSEIAPSSFFLINYILSFALGAFFLLACLISVSLSSMRRLFSNFRFPDLMCSLTIVLILGFNMLLVLVGRLWVPYVNVTKYAYPTVPLFCLLAASLIAKSSTLLTSKDFEGGRRVLTYIAALAGLLFLFASIAVNMNSLIWMTGLNYLLFTVEGEIGYPFFLSSNNGNEYSVLLLGLAFTVIVICLSWYNSDKLKSLSGKFKRVWKNHSQSRVLSL